MQLRWQASSRGAARNHAAQLAIIKQMSRQVSPAQLANIKQMNRQESLRSAGNYEADEQAGITKLTWQLSSR